MTETAAKRGASAEYSVEESALGRIVVAPHVPSGHAVFYTTRDFDGGLNRGSVNSLTAFVRDRFGIECSLNTCTQVHGTTVRRVGGATGDWTECDSCDALWSDEAGIALGIKVADCLPVTLIDADHGVIANIHSGWRGAVQRITAATLDALESGTAFAPSSATAWLGPSIRVCCFEVGEEVVEQFLASRPFSPRRGEGGRRPDEGSPSPPLRGPSPSSAGRSSSTGERTWLDRTRGPRPHIDIAALTIELLRERGVERIFDSGLCTRCGELFHSYRRDAGRGGRNLAIAAR
jgi:hypothetical protein